MEISGYKKIKLWNGFGVKWSDCKTGLRNFMVTLKSQIACSEWQKSEISKKHKDDIILNLFKRLKKDIRNAFC